MNINEDGMVDLMKFYKRDYNEDCKISLNKYIQDFTKQNPKYYCNKINNTYFRPEPYETFSKYIFEITFTCSEYPDIKELVYFLKSGDYLITNPILDENEAKIVNDHCLKHNFYSEAIKKEIRFRKINDPNLKLISIKQNENKWYLTAPPLPVYEAICDIDGKKIIFNVSGF
jgi:hypothetical protein